MLPHLSEDVCGDFRQRPGLVQILCILYLGSMDHVGMVGFSASECARDCKEYQVPACLLDTKVQAFLLTYLLTTHH